MTARRIFISYHRRDAAADANALYQSLRLEFGEDRLFKDVDNVPLGANWKAAVRDAVRESSVVLAVMGRTWRFTGAIQIEIETAFQEGIPVIPLLMDGARMEDLVAEIEGEGAVLGDLNAASVDHASWNRDLIPVLGALRRLLGEPDAGVAPIGSDAATRAGATTVDQVAQAPPGRPDEPWTAQLTDFQDIQGFALQVRLTTRTFEIEWRTGWVRNSVVVDGVMASIRAAISNREVHVFKLAEGDIVHTAVLDVRGALSIESISLVVDGRTLLEATKPIELEGPIELEPSEPEE